MLHARSILLSVCMQWPAEEMGTPSLDKLGLTQDTLLKFLKLIMGRGDTRQSLCSDQQFLMELSVFGDAYGKILQDKAVEFDALPTFVVLQLLGPLIRGLVAHDITAKLDLQSSMLWSICKVVALQVRLACDSQYESVQWDVMTEVGFPAGLLDAASAAAAADVESMYI